MSLATDLRCTLRKNYRRRKAIRRRGINSRFIAADCVPTVVVPISAPKMGNNPLTSTRENFKIVGERQMTSSTPSNKPPIVSLNIGGLLTLGRNRICLNNDKKCKS